MRKTNVILSIILAILIFGCEKEDDALTPTDNTSNNNNNNSNSGELNAFFEFRQAGNQANITVANQYLDTSTVSFENKSTGDIDRIEWDFDGFGSATTDNPSFQFDLYNLTDTNEFDVTLTVIDNEGNQDSHTERIIFPILRTSGYISIDGTEYDIQRDRCSLCNYYLETQVNNSNWVEFSLRHYYGEGSFSKYDLDLSLGEIITLNNTYISSTSSSVPNGIEFFIDFHGYETIDDSQNTCFIKKGDHLNVYERIEIDFTLRHKQNNTMHSGQLRLYNVLHKDLF